MQTLRRNSHTAIYSINILSKYSSLISHRPSMFEGRHIDYRSSKVDTSITDLRRSTHPIIGLRRSTHPSPKVDTSIFESRHIDLRRSIHRDLDLRRATHQSSKGDTSIFESRHIYHRSSKVDASIFEDRRRKHHTYNSSSNIVHNCAPM